MLQNEKKEADLNDQPPGQTTALSRDIGNNDLIMDVNYKQCFADQSYTSL